MSIDGQIERAFAADALWLSTLLLASGLLAAGFWRTRPARGHGVVLLSMLAAAIAPLVSQVVRSGGWGMLSETPAVAAPVGSTESIAARPRVDREIPPLNPPLIVPEPHLRPISVVNSPGIDHASSTGRTGAPRTSPLTASHRSASTAAPRDIQQALSRGASWVWIGLTVLALLRLFLSVTAAARLVRRSHRVADGRWSAALTSAASEMEIRTVPEMRASDEVYCPSIWCWSKRPVLLIPSSTGRASWSLDWVSVFRHELAHLRRRDHWWAMLAEIVCCVLPWQPLAWWARRRLGRLSEQACDDWVLGEGRCAERYAETLLRLTPQRSYGGVMSAVGGASSLRERVSRLLRQRLGRPQAGLAWTVLACLVPAIAVVAAALAQVGPDGRSSNTEATAQTSALDKALSGIVRDAAGNPAPDAAVWVVASRYPDSPAVIGTTKTMSDGRFELDGLTVRKLSVEGPQGSYVVARDKRKRIGWRRIERNLEDQRIVLLDVADFEGRLIGAGKVPIVGARVNILFLCRESLRERRTMGLTLPPELTEEFRAETDADGKFVFRNVPTIGSARGKIAAAGHEGGWVSWNLTGPLEIPLERGGSVSGSIQWDGQAESLEGVWLNCYSTDNRRRVRTDSYDLPRSGYRAVVAADGSFRITGVPAGQHRIYVQLGAGAKVYAAPSDTFDVAADANTAGVVVTLHKAVPVRGRVVDKTTGAGVAGATVYVLSVDTEYAGRTVTTDDQGRYLTFTKSGPVQAKVSRLPGNDRSVGPQTAKPTEVIEATGETQMPDIPVVVRPIVEVHGRVVDAQSGDGIQDVAIRIGWMSGPNMLGGWNLARTDVEGRYAGHIQSGRIMVSVYRVPNHHLMPWIAGPRKQLEADADLEWPTFELRRAVAVSGVVVDEAGRPQPGAEVRASSLEDFSAGMASMSISDRWKPVICDEAGKFVIARADPTDVISLWARNGGAVTFGRINIVPAEQTEPLRLVVSGEHAFRLKGRVTGQTGAPIEGASVVITWGARHAGARAAERGYGFSIPQPAILTDEQGRFESAALWPDARYKVRIKADGYTRSESSDVNGVAGETRDVETFELERVAATVSGRVVDSSGNGIERVRVFSVDDAPRQPRTTTDENGAFRLTGLLDGPVYVFADKRGYRFTSQRGRSGSGLTITLLRDDEPRPPRARPTRRHPTRGAQLQLARILLEETWKRPGARTDPGARTLVLAMARIDPAVARRWSAELDGRYDHVVRVELAKRAADRDADEAIALLTDVGDATASTELRLLARKFVESAPDKSLRFAEEALARTRALDEPRRSGAMAQVGAVLLDLGKTEVARAVLSEAAENIRGMRLDSQSLSGWARREVVAGLAPLDFELAASLLDVFEKTADRDRATSRAIVAVARHDHVRALELLSRIETRYLHPPAKRSIAYYAARKDPQAAIDIAESITESEYKFLAYSQLAVAIAPRDRQLAHSMVDRAMQVLVDSDTAFLGWGIYATQGVYAAHLAMRAGRIGYRDMETLTHRILSMRVDRFGGSSPGGPHATQVATAKVLALSDPQAARQLLVDIEPRWKRFEQSESHEGLGRLRRSDWFRAWALADPLHACELVTAEFEGWDNDPDRALLKTGVTTVTDLLTLPKRDRSAGRSPVFMNMMVWTPDEER